VISDSRKVTIQVRRSGRWIEVGTTKTRRGKYRWATSVEGTYRAVVDGAAGPSVRIR
jgi:hypothetical protein